MKFSSRVAADSVGREVGVGGRTYGHTHVLFIEKYWRERELFSEVSIFSVLN